MKTLWIRVAAVLALFSLAACASVPLAPAEADAAAKRFQAPPDQAQIYVYRHESFGAAIKMALSLNGEPIGQTAAKTYALRTVAPGTHTLSSKAENTDTLTLEVVAGESYYVWQEVKLGVVMARTQLKQMDAAPAQAAIAQCRLIR